VTQAKRRALVNLMAPRTVSVEVANTSFEGGTVGGGAIVAGVLGALFTGGLWLVVTAAGAAAGAAMASSEKNMRDLLATRGSVTDGAATEVARVRALRDDLIDLLQDEWLGDDPARPAAPDDRELTALVALRDAYEGLSQRLE